MEEACNSYKRSKPLESEMFIHLKKTVEKEVKGKTKELVEKTIYRRIGADKLPDDTVNPAPWARLDRQFFIKLQGEDEGVRKASKAEIEKVQKLEEVFGYCPPNEGGHKHIATGISSVDELMAHAV